jgi:hypothetical protein
VPHCDFGLPIFGFGITDLVFSPSTIDSLLLPGNVVRSTFLQIQNRKSKIQNRDVERTTFLQLSGIRSAIRKAAAAVIN